jgi:hypothetical protein
VPGDVSAAASAVEAASDAYIAGYNLWMHHVLSEDGQRHFPKGKRLISHWNLRDELKANYADPDAVAKQRTIVAVMERIVTQTIPAAVIDNPRLDWNPFTNQVTAAPAAELEPDAPADRPTAPATAPEPVARFQHVLDAFHAAQAIDRYAPTAPTHLARSFAAAEMPEPRVRELIVSILSSPNVALAAAEIERRLGRQARPAGPLVRVRRRRAVRGRARRRDPQALPDAGGVQGRPAAHPDQARLRPQARQGDRRAHRGRSVARRRPRDGGDVAPGPAAPAHPRREARHGLQGLQHRGA